jgi:CheY-like chemotaxis protein
VTELRGVTGIQMPEMVKKTRVLLVDDDPLFLGRARHALEPVARLRIAQSGAEALQTLPLWTPHVILFDMLLDDLDGFSFLDELTRFEVERTPFILCTIDGRGADTRVRPLPEWHVGTLVRSVPLHQLRSAVLQAARCSDPGIQRLVSA